MNDWNSCGKVKKLLLSVWTQSLSFIVRLFWKEMPLADYETMSKEHSYQPEFLTNRIFSCTNCINMGYNIDSFKDDAFIRNFIQLGDKSNHLAGFFTLDKIEFWEAVEKDILNVPLATEKLK